MQNKFISLLNDTTFKYLWKNRDTRPFLEKVIYEVTGINLDKYKLVDNELNSGNEYKDYRLDILLEYENNLVNIEMNHFVREYTKIKNHAYLYRLAGNAYLKGDKYQTFYVTQINFNDCYCIENKEIDVCVYEFRDIKNNLIIEGIKCYEIYLEKYKKLCYNEASKVSKYLSFFKADSFDRMRVIAKNDKEMLKIVDELERLSREKYFGGLYDARIVEKKCMNTERSAGIEEGIEKGLKQGEKTKAQEIAISMLKDNIEIKTISQYTGLTSNEILSLGN